MRGTEQFKFVMLLTAIHLLAGIGLALLSANAPAVSSALFIALIFCQTSLVGIWAGLGTSGPFWRIAGLVWGSLFLGIELGLGIDELNGLILAWVILPTLFVAGTTVVVRRWKSVTICSRTPATAQREPLQFTVRHLMVFTLIVAGLSALGRLTATTLYGDEDSITVLILAICFATVGVASCWAAMGSGHPLLRSLIVLLIAGTSGAFIYFRIEDDPLSRSWDELVFWVGVSVVQTFYLLASLLALRLRGYRLVANANASSA